MRDRRRRGASLIEVLVVLVVILIGVSAVVRIFPIGLGTLRQSENRTLASRLASQMMEQVKADEANLPAGVLYAFPTGNGMNIPAQELDPDDLSNQDLDPIDPTDPPYNPYFSDINKFRYIEGEPVKVPLPTATAFGSGSLYTVKFGPIFMDENVGNPERVPADDAQVRFFATYLRVYGAPLRGIAAEAEDGPGQAGRLRGPLTYLIDLGEGGETPRIMFYPRRPANPARTVPSRVFRIVYSYFTENDGDQFADVASADVSITVPDSRDAVWQEIPAPPGASSFTLVPGSETVNREFTRLKRSETSWDPDDPYQYKLISDNIAASPNMVGSATAPAPKVFANMGVLAFNPYGATYSERGDVGQQAFTAFLNYSVLDWHIIRDDREVPSTLLNPIARYRGAIPIKLTLSYVKQVGDPQPDGSLYGGLYNRPSTPSPGGDVQVFDLGGSVQDPADPSKPWPPGTPLVGDLFDEDAGNAQDPNAHFWIDVNGRGGSYRTGTIYINPNLVPSGSQLRILYKAEGDWAVSLQKAYASYERAFGENGVASPRPTSYNNYGQQGTRLYFNRSDLNKSVVAMVEYTVNGEVQRTQPLQLTIDQAGTGADAAYAYVDLADRKYAPEIASASDWRLFGQIVGVSIKTRVIWKDAGNAGNTWRIQDLDTYITRGAGRS